MMLRADGDGCAGCAQAHPILGSSLSNDNVYSRKLWSWVLVCTPNVHWLPPALYLNGPLPIEVDRDVGYVAPEKINCWSDFFLN